MALAQSAAKSPLLAWGFQFSASSTPEETFISCSPSAARPLSASHSLSNQPFFSVPCLSVFVHPGTSTLPLSLGSPPRYLSSSRYLSMMALGCLLGAFCSLTRPPSLTHTHAPLLGSFRESSVPGISQPFFTTTLPPQLIAKKTR